jgi:hypothetical protein
MPNFKEDLNNIRESVERPIAYDITRQLMNIMGISDDTIIYFYGEEGKAYQQNSTVTKDVNKLNRWAYDKAVTVEIDETVDKTKLYSIISSGVGNIYTFRDPELGVFIKPIYANTEVKITFKYKTTDKNTANRWYNQMTVRASQMSDINMHTVSYHYNVPESFIYILQEIFRLRENQAGYGDSFDKYFTQYLTNNASVVTNLAGVNGVLAISERQNRVQGLYDWPGLPDKPEKDETNYVAQFTYKFSYEKPIASNMIYPLVVHNQLLDQKYRPSAPAYDLAKQATSFSMLTAPFVELESDRFNDYYNSCQGFSYPIFDEFQPNSLVPSSIRVITLLVQIVPSDVRSLLNLNELGDNCLDKDIIQFLSESEYPYIGLNFQSIFCLSLYKESFIQRSGIVSVNNSLEVVATEDLNLRKTYRLRLGLITDIDLLSKDAIARLKKYPLARDKIIKAIDTALSVNVGQTDIPKNVTSNDDRIKLGATPSGSTASMHIGMNTVETLFVTVDKTSNI